MYLFLVSAGTLALTLTALPARAETWQEVFAADTHAVVFLTGTGGLARAPFHLAGAESLWAPRVRMELAGALVKTALFATSLPLLARSEGREGIARFRASPVGRGVAWIERDSEEETIRCWIADDDSARLRLRYRGVRPSDLGFTSHYLAVPTIRGVSARGACFIAPGSFLLGYLAPTLEWTADGRGVLFGSDAGVIYAPAGGGALRPVSDGLVESLEPLAPSPMFHAVSFARGEEGWRQENVVLSSAAGEWRALEADTFKPGSPWTASPAAAWWAHGSTIRGVRTDEGAPVEWETGARVTWLGYLPQRRAVAWAESRGIFLRPEAGGPTVLVLAAATSIRAVLDVQGSRWLGVVTQDSLVIWDPLDDRVSSYPLERFQPDVLLETPEGVLLAMRADARAGGAVLFRADASAGKLVRVELPRGRGGRLFVAPGRRHVLLAKVAAKTPELIQIYDVSRGEWIEVANPGIAGWEPLGYGENRAVEPGSGPGR